MAMELLHFTFVNFYTWQRNKTIMAFKFFILSATYKMIYNLNLVFLFENKSYLQLNVLPVLRYGGAGTSTVDSSKIKTCGDN